MKGYLLHTFTRNIKFTIIAVTFILPSCSSSISIRNHIDKNSPFDLTISTRDTATGLTESAQTKIAVNSDKYSKLINWLYKNENGWHPAAPASYVNDILVTQNLFTLLYNKSGEAVIIGFNNKQYSKSIKKGELDFLAK